jgi:hypothetical protein
MGLEIFANVRGISTAMRMWMDRMPLSSRRSLAGVPLITPVRWETHAWVILMAMVMWMGLMLSSSMRILEEVNFLIPVRRVPNLDFVEWLITVV